MKEVEIVGFMNFLTKKKNAILGSPLAGSKKGALPPVSNKPKVTPQSSIIDDSPTSSSVKGSSPIENSSIKHPINSTVESRTDNYSLNSNSNIVSSPVNDLTKTDVVSLTNNLPKTELSKEDLSENNLNKNSVATNNFEATHNPNLNNGADDEHYVESWTPKENIAINDETSESVINKSVGGDQLDSIQYSNFESLPEFSDDDFTSDVNSSDESSRVGLNDNSINPISSSVNKTSKFINENSLDVDEQIDLPLFGSSAIVSPEVDENSPLDLENYEPVFVNKYPSSSFANQQGVFVSKESYVHLLEYLAVSSSQTDSLLKKQIDLVKFDNSMTKLLKKESIALEKLHKRIIAVESIILN